MRQSQVKSSILIFLILGGTAVGWADVGITAAGDPIEALEDLTQGAEYGDSDAQVELANRYLHGIGATKDPEIAAGWFRKAAAKGNPWAKMNLAAMLVSGEGIPQNYKEAMSLLLQSTGTTRGVALYNIGVMHAQGYGVAKDSVEAAKWFHKAYRRGDIDIERKTSDYHESIDDDSETAAILKLLKQLSPKYSDALHRKAKAELVRRGESVVDLMWAEWEGRGDTWKDDRGNLDLAFILFGVLDSIGTDHANEFAVKLFLGVNELEPIGPQKIAAMAQLLSQRPRPRMLPTIVAPDNSCRSRACLAVLHAHLRASQKAGQFKRYAKMSVLHILRNLTYRSPTPTSILAMFGPDESAYATDYLMKRQQVAGRDELSKEINFILNLPGGPRQILKAIPSGNIPSKEFEQWDYRKFIPVAEELDQVITQVSPYRPETQSTAATTEDMIDLLWKVDRNRALNRMHEYLAGSGWKKGEYAAMLIRHGRKIDMADKELVSIVRDNRDSVCTLAKQGSKAALSEIHSSIRNGMEGQSSANLQEPLRCLSGGAWKYADSSIIDALSEISSYRDRVISQSAKGILAQIAGSRLQKARVSK